MRLFDVYSKTVIVNNEIIFFDTYICYKKRKVRMKEQKNSKYFIDVIFMLQFQSVLCLGSV